MSNKGKNCEEEVMTEFDFTKNITVKNKLDYTPKIYTINFWHDFDDPRYYIPYFKVLEDAHEEDQIVFYFNSPGGEVTTLNLFLNALRRCKSKYILARVNYAASAAALLALYCDNIEFNTGATLMLHNYKGFFYGKGQEIKADFEHSDKKFEQIIRYICKKILTDEEIDELLNGKDFYFSGEEAVKKLKEMVKIRDKENKKKKK
jgi:ATP-dependent protease ClpP protease subunit